MEVSGGGDIKAAVAAHAKNSARAKKTNPVSAIVHKVAARDELLP